MYKYLLLWGLLLCCIPSLCAQETITVRGRVTDTQGSPLLGVSVILEGTTKGASTKRLLRDSSCASWLTDFYL